MKKIFCSKSSITVILLTIFSVSFSIAQSFKNTRLYNQQLIYEDSNWCIINIRNSDTSYFKIDTNTISLRLNNLSKKLDSNLFVYHEKLTVVDSFLNYYKYSIDYNGITFKKLLDSLTFNNQWQDIVLSDFGTLNSNDPYFNNQTYLGSTYLDVEGTRAFWGYGNPNITVAIIDGFFDLNHPDLGSVNGGYSNIWVNNGEDAWTPQNPTGNGIDDDNNGLVDDWKGYDFYYNDNDVRPYLLNANSQTIPYNFHGSVVAGIVGAKTNNNLGVAGIAGGNNNEGVKLMCLNVAQYKTNLTFAEPVIDKIALAKAILYACQNGAKIISLTVAFAPNTYAPMVDEAINIAINKYDCMIFCSVGNGSSGSGFTNYVHYPANINDVIAIGAYNSSKINTYGRGPELDFVAFDTQVGTPGPYLLNPTNSYGIHGGGTSLATAQMVGLSALVLSKYECLPPKLLNDYLIASCQIGDFPCTPINGRCNEYGYGQPMLLNLESILNNSEFNNPVITSEMVINDINICQTDITVNAGATLTINGTLIMSNGKRIIVNPRGKLIVQNNGKITSNCEWGGVEVYGDQNVNTPQGTTADGYALIRTGGIIENAKIGVKTIDEGIVEANDAKFLNNYIGIYMYPQTSLSSVNFTQSINLSKVLNSDFKIDKELKSTSYNIGVTRKSFNSFIKMEDLKYTIIESNNFIVTNTQNIGVAILGFKVDARIARNLFNGVYAGIEIGGFSRFKFGIQDLNIINFNQFTNVSRGITLYSYFTPTISYNNFSIANTNYELSEDGYFEYNWAIVSSNNAAIIKENIISSNDGRAYGSIINNSSIYKKATIDQLLKNTFQHLYIGSQFEFIQKGLRPLCNTYSNITKHAWSISPNRSDKNNNFPNIGNPSKNQVGGNLFYDSDINEFKHIRSRKIFNYVAANDPIIAIPTDNTTNLSVEQVTLSNESFCEEVQFNLNYFLCESQECELQQLIYSYEAENDTDRKDFLESAIIDKFVENEDESGLLFFLTENSLTQTYSKELFMTYFDKGDITNAEYYMALMPITTQAENDFVVLFETLLDLRSEFKSLSDLTQTQINTLNIIKSNNNDASLFAANMLKFGIGTKFNQNPSLWDNEPETPMLLLSLANKNANTIKFYPNPSTVENYLQIESIAGDEILSVEMYNNIGILVYKELVDRKVGIRIENKKLPIGLYNVKVNTRNNASTFKYIKQN